MSDNSINSMNVISLDAEDGPSPRRGWRHATAVGLPRLWQTVADLGWAVVAALLVALDPGQVVQAGAGVLLVGAGAAQSVLRLACAGSSRVPRVVAARPEVPMLAGVIVIHDALVGPLNVMRSLGAREVTSLVVVLGVVLLVDAAASGLGRRLRRRRSAATC